MMIQSKKKSTVAIKNYNKIIDKQKTECLFIFFYIIYSFEFIINLIAFGNLKEAHGNTSFCKEAFYNMHYKNYLESRRPFAWMSYFF